MITEILLIMFRGIISLVCSLLPTPESLPTGLANSLNQFNSVFVKLNSFLPIDTLFLAFGFLLTFEGGILFFKFFNFALKKLRGSG